MNTFYENSRDPVKPEGGSKFHWLLWGTAMRMRNRSHGPETCGNRRGMILVSLLLFLGVLMASLSAYYAYGMVDFQSVASAEYLQQAFYLAEAGIDFRLVELSGGDTSTNTHNGNLGSGSYASTYTAATTVGNTIVPAVVRSVGTVTVNGRNYQRTLEVNVVTEPIITMRGAVAANGAVSTNGNITVDGRDHDENGNVIGPGKYGISTAGGSFAQGGSSDVGGSGIAPGRPANPATYEVHAPPLPVTPEAVLGMTPGSLDQYKQAIPNAPFTNKIVYITESWTAANLTGCSGILICHNAAGNALMKNIHGTFKGLIITDDVDNINGNAVILGGVVALYTGAVHVGNGNADILYSSKVLEKLPLTKVKVSAWRDARNA